jgi:hypothetical protein
MDIDDRPGHGPVLATLPIEMDVVENKKPVVLETTNSNSSSDEKQGDPEAIIKTSADASLHLLSLRDDFDPALTFRSLRLVLQLSLQLCIRSTSSNRR